MIVFFVSRDARDKFFQVRKTCFPKTTGLIGFIFEVGLVKGRNKGIPFDQACFKGQNFFCSAMRLKRSVTTDGRQLFLTLAKFVI